MEYKTGDLIIVTKEFETSGGAYIPAGVSGKIDFFDKYDRGAFVLLRFSEGMGFRVLPSDVEPDTSSLVPFECMCKVN